MLLQPHSFEEMLARLADIRKAPRVLILVGKHEPSEPTTQIAHQLDTLLERDVLWVAIPEADALHGFYAGQTALYLETAAELIVGKPCAATRRAFGRWSKSERVAIGESILAAYAFVEKEKRLPLDKLALRCLKVLERELRMAKLKPKEVYGAMAKLRPKPLAEDAMVRDLRKRWPHTVYISLHGFDQLGEVVDPHTGKATSIEAYMRTTGGIKNYIETCFPQTHKLAQHIVKKARLDFRIEPLGSPIHSTAECYLDYAFEFFYNVAFFEHYGTAERAQLALGAILEPVPHPRDTRGIGQMDATMLFEASIPLLEVSTINKRYARQFLVFLKELVRELRRKRA